MITAVDKRKRMSVRGIGVMLGLLALPLLYGGGVLISVAGSPYYFLAGAALLATAMLFWMYSRWALWIYGALTIVTAIWTVWEVGLDPWAMLPRLAMVNVLGVVLLLPFIRRRLSGGPRLSHKTLRAAAILQLAVMIVLPVAALLVHSEVSLHMGGLETSAAGSTEGTGADWADYGGTPAGERFSSLEQITPANVAKLHIAWTYSFGDAKPNGLEISPLKIANLVFVCNSQSEVAALDSETGKQIWRFTPEVDLKSPPFRACRALAYYRIPGASGPCAERIYSTTINAVLHALDAKSGALCRDFGLNGAVSLLEGLGTVIPGYYTINGGPSIARDKLVVGGTVVDNQMVDEPSGVIRAYDAVTGKLAWAYDVGRPERTSLPPAGEFYTRGTPNSWSQIAFDGAFGLVYVPTGNATPDYYGAERRPFDEEITSVVMALDVETGRRRWAFQTTHHDLWDYDVAAQPILADLTGSHGERTPALIQLTKRGQIFVLNRESGAPLAPVVEMPVPSRGSAPGERLAPTQPFSVGMPDLAGAPLAEAMSWGITPFDQLWCRIAFKRARYEGPMTPPGLSPSIEYPGNLGANDWGGGSYDPVRHVMVTVTAHVPTLVRLIPRVEANARGAFAMGRGREGVDALKDINAQEGLPYAERAVPFLSPLGVPCTQPPWGRISAVDVEHGRFLWSRPLGDTGNSGPLGLRTHMPLTMGVPSLGGVLLTGSGLTFAAASIDKRFRAFETATGRLLWTTTLPASGNAPPITYWGATSGSQYILIPAGGHHSFGGPPGDSVVAFRLSKP